MAEGPKSSQAQQPYDWYDMHCHLDFCSDPAAFAKAGAEQRVAFFSTTVTPADYLAHADALDGEPNVRLGVGMHPWWLEEDENGPDQVVRIILDTRFVGEIGMDCSPRFAFFSSEQHEAFQKIAVACASEGGKVLSIHSVRSASKILDILEKTGAIQNCICIMHWFTDSADQFIRAQKAGCLFSVNERMISTHKGREYVRQMAPETIVLETDMPPKNAGSEYTPAGHRLLLQETFTALCEARRISDESEKEALRAQIRETSARIFEGR